MFTLYPLNLTKILYNSNVVYEKRGEKMAVLTLKNDNPEYHTFPPILKEYASYSVAIRGNAEKTVCEYLLDLRTFFRYYLTVKKRICPTPEEFENISILEIDISDVRAITQYHIIEYLMYVSSERKNNTTTRMRKLSAIKSFFRFAHTKRHYIDSNPAADVDAPKKSKVLPKYLTTEEAVRFLETVRSDVDSKTVVRDFAIATMFLNTGIRLSELVGLNLESFDPALTQIRVLGKGNKERVVYLNDAVKAAVSDYLRVRLDPKYIITSSRAFFLSRRQQRISAKTVQWMIGKYLDLAGLGARGLSVHKLRHTAATLMYQSGQVDIRVLKDILGHEQLNTTQIYTHLVDRNMQTAMDNNPLANLKIKPPEVSFDDE